MSTDQYYHQIQQKFYKYIIEDDSQDESSLHQSNCNNNILFYTRLLSFLSISGIYIWSIIVVQISLFQNYMYLTMIGYFLTWLFFAMTMIAIIFHKIGIKSHNFNTYTQIVFQLAFCLGLPITIVFWAFLWKVVLDIKGITSEVLIIYAFLHALPLIWLTVDFIQNKFCFSIKHLPVLIVLEVLYGILNIIYSLTFMPIYKPISWRSIGSYLIAIGSILITFLFHYIGRIVYKKCKKRESNRQRQSLLSDGSLMTSQSQNNGRIMNEKNEK